MQRVRTSRARQRPSVAARRRRDTDTERRHPTPTQRRRRRRPPKPTPTKPATPTPTKSAPPTPLLVQQLERCRQRTASSDRDVVKLVDRRRDAANLREGRRRLACGFPSNGSKYRPRRLLRRQARGRPEDPGRQVRLRHDVRSASQPRRQIPLPGSRCEVGMGRRPVVAVLQHVAGRRSAERRRRPRRRDATERPTPTPSTSPTTPTRSCQAKEAPSSCTSVTAAARPAAFRSRKRTC